MTDRDQIRSWLFRIVTTDAALDRLENDGLAVRPSEDPRAVQRVLSLEDFSPEVRRSAMRALPAYLGFFCLENAVRELVSERLSENHGADWWQDCATTAIQNKVEKRREQEGQNRWHVRRGEQEIYFTDFGDLRLLIQNNWEDFEDLFPDQNWVTTRLEEMEASRNIIAHSNTLDEREIERIQLYMEDWVRQVG